MRNCGPVLAAIIVTATAAGERAHVEIRGTPRDAETVSGEMLLLDDAGIRLRLDDGTTELFVWDEVRHVRMVRHDPRLDDLLPIAEDLWRARARLQRHDVTLAEPIFERLFERYRGQTNEAALIVAEGLLRCRLARQAQEQAIVPMLETIRLRRAGQRTNRYASFVPVIDDETEICALLPPIWTLPQYLRPVAVDMERYQRSDDRVVREVARLYLLAAQRAVGEQPGDLPDELPDHAGLSILHECVSLQLHGEVRPVRWTDRMRGRRPSRPGWSIAWMDFSRGAYQMDHGESREEQMQGCVRILRVPAEHARSQPYLSGLALHRVAAWFERDGQPNEAATLRQELAGRFPNHPVLRR